MPGVNEGYQHPGEFCLVLDKLAKLVKSPGVVLPPLALSNRDAVSDMGKVFKGDTPTAVFGLRNNTLGNTVIDVGGKPSFLIGTLNKQSLSRLSASGLELAPEPSVALTQAVDLRPGIDSAVRIGGDVHDAEVDTQELSWVAGRQFLDFAGLEKVESAVTVNKVGLTEHMSEKVRLACASDKRDGQPSPGRPDRDGAGSYLPGQDTLVIANAAAPVEGAPGITPGFISIGYLCQHSNHDLRRQIKAVAQVIVEQVVKVILAKGFGLPGPLADIVGGIVHCLQRAQQSSVLFRVRRQFDLRYQLHGNIIPQYSTLDKKGEAHSSTGKTRGLLRQRL